MITSVTIESFRGVREGGVDGLAPISILVGPNSTGKSTVLEAIAVTGFGRRVDETVRLLMRRGGPALDALEQVVARGAASAKLSVQLIDGARKAVEVAIPGGTPDQRTEALAARLAEPLIGVLAADVVVWVDHLGRLSNIFQSAHSVIAYRPEDYAAQLPLRFVDVEAVRAAGALEDAYTDIERAGRSDVVIRALQRSLAGLRDLRILKSRDKFILHTFVGTSAPVPAFVAGDGFKRFLALAAAVLTASKGVVLLEEPESFQHPRYLQELATLLHLAAKDGTQIILSTHSIELIDLLLGAPEAEGQTYPAVHRLRLHDGKLEATSIPRESALYGRESLLEDLRA